MSKKISKEYYWVSMIDDPPVFEIMDKATMKKKCSNTDKCSANMSKATDLTSVIEQNFYHKQTNICRKKNNDLSLSMNSNVCVVQTVGKRYGNKQEDRYFVYDDEKTHNYSIIGVFDGHAGDDVSEVVKKVMLFSLKIYLDWVFANNVSKINTRYLKQLFLKINEYIKALQLPSGAVCAVVIITKKKLISLHVGDCKVIVLENSGRVAFESNDHTCSNPSEKKRLTKNYSQNIIENNRVCGILAPSRAFGDLDLPVLDAITPVPEISVIDITKKLKYLIVGSDGLFDHVNDANKFFRNVIKKCAAASSTAQKNDQCLCEHVYEMAMDNASKHCNHKSCYDNLTFILYDFSRKTSSSR